MDTNKKNNFSRRIWIGAILLVLIAGLGVWFTSHKQDAAFAKESSDRQAAAKAGPVVKTMKAGFGVSGHDLVLIGEALPMQTVTLYSKTSGYINKILVDKGDKVSRGQLLADIISPEVDQAYRSALADLENKRKILKREQLLQSKDYVALQEKEQAETDVKVAEATVNSLHEQQQYKQITAPFNGTVTARFADPGALVQNATNSQSSALPVVTVAQLDQIKIYVYVEQSDALYLKDGYPVTITMTEKPEFSLHATITRMAGTLDPKTRMMLAEIDVPNKNNAIIPGSYVQVHISPPTTTQLQVPAEALVIKDNKYYVPVVAADSTLHFKPILVGKNDGIKITVLDGITSGDIIGLNIGQTLNDGQKVRPQMGL